MTWHLFKHENLLNEEDETWHLQTWTWMLTHCGGTTRLRRSPLVTPTDECFPPLGLSGEELARSIFDRVRKFADMEPVICELIGERGDPEFVGELVSGHGVYRSRCGGYQEDEKGVVMTYDPALTANPMALVSVLAHEVAHYRIAHINEAPPGGDDMKECATDLMTVFLGFGIFGADAAFRFWARSGRGQWGFSRWGYLREIDWAYALAVFSYLRGDDVTPLKQWIKPAIYAETVEASKEIAADPSRLETLRRH